MTVADVQLPPSAGSQAEAAESSATVVARARVVQASWASSPLPERLRALRRLRHAIASHGTELAETLGHAGRTVADSLAAEVVPLADAVRFLERFGGRILRPVRWGRRGRPAWLSRATLEVRREPLGVVLIIAPENYPLFLAGVQAVQALAAGNAVIIKPAPGRSAPVHLLRSLAIRSGLPASLLSVVGEDPGEVAGAVDAGVDKVVLTGSAETGRRVLADLAPRCIPAVMELSGCDAVFVRPDADLDFVVRHLAFGMAFNGGRTCVAPRRVFVDRARSTELCDRLVRRVGRLDAVIPERRLLVQAERLIADAVAGGATCLTGGVDGNAFRPAVLTNVDADMPIARHDLFVPVLLVIPVTDDAHALRLNERCPFALGAVVFGGPAGARELARRVPAGVVVVNDVIVPHADARMPFGGARASGFGTTRGAEGLLEMTRPKAIVTRGGRFRPHLDPARPGDAAMFADYLRAAHGALIRGRLAAGVRLVRSLVFRGNPARAATLTEERH